MTSKTINEATRPLDLRPGITIPRLLGAYKAEAEHYVGGALAILRLAPQDLSPLPLACGWVIKRQET